jgi:predicted TIM-barrel fold metal-dependent hydrolase
MADLHVEGVDLVGHRTAQTTSFHALSPVETAQAYLKPAHCPPLRAARIIWPGNPKGAIMQYKRISADSHLDLPWMPPDLFTSMAPRELKDRMPFVTDTDEGPKWMAKNGATFGFKNGVGPAGSKFVPGKHGRVDIMAETGLYADGAKDIRRISDPHLRIKDLDRDGVDAEVIYGILGAASRLNDREAGNQMLMIYNDWLKEFCSHYPDRHIGLACLPYGDIDAAVKEIHRVAKMSIKGLELSCSWDMEPMWHPMWEPLWKAVNEVQLPLHFHTFPNVPPDTIGKHPGRVGRSVFFTVVSGFQMNLVNILAAIMGANVLERYPNIRIAFGESGSGWIPYALDRMDFEWEDRFFDLGLKMKPSDYWRRQCKATFQFDRIGAKLIDDMGAESLMWGSDYPHGDGVWPHSDKYIREQFANVPAEQVKMITCTNAGKFYGLIN